MAVAAGGDGVARRPSPSWTREDLLDALEAPAAVRERIAELAEGNPLFIEQLAAFAGEGGEQTSR